MAARPPRRASATPVSDTRLLVALEALQAMNQRLSVLEATGAASEAVLPAPVLTEQAGLVSVVVSTLDRADWLDRALSALAYQRHPDFEVIVVAGPSGDATADVLARHAPRIRMAHCPVANLSMSRNIGLRLARGEIVAFLDDDAAPEPDWLQRLHTPYLDAQVGGVGGAIRDRTGIGYQCRIVTSDRFARTVQRDGLRAADLDPPGTAVERFLSLTGANSSFRRRALLDIGGFDEAYAYFLDETDVCLRIVEAGWRLEVALDAEVHHACAPSAQRRVDHAPISLTAPARSTAYFAFRNGAPRYGAAAAADHLQAYAQGLKRDIAWRRDEGLSDPEEAERLQAEVDAGLAEGVRGALGAPRRLLTSAAPPSEPCRPRPVSVIRPAPDRLRLCLLCQDYPQTGPQASPPGGVAVWTQALALSLAARGHEVSVIARTDGVAPSVAFEAQRGAGVWVHRTASAEAAPSDFAGLKRRSDILHGAPASVADPCRAAAAEVARVEPRRRFDFVMGPLWDLEPAALLDSPWPTAVSLHTACAQMPPFKPEWSEAYRRTHVEPVIAAERRLLDAAPLVLSNSHAAARDIGAALDLPDLPLRARVIPHGLPDLAEGVAPAPRKDGVEVLFVGRLERRKGVDVLLAAAPALLSLAPEVRLVIVGEEVDTPGVCSARSLFLASHAGAPWLSRVRFEGPLSRADLLARYAAADLVATPSRYESFGLTALEAAIFGKPCVASAVGGLCEIVQDGETGRLIAPEQPAALASALLTLVRSAQLRARMGSAARRRYEAHFTADAMAMAYEAWVRDAIGIRRRLAAE